MKMKQTLKLLIFSAASLLALQAANALPVIQGHPAENWIRTSDVNANDNDLVPFSSSQAWQDLQDKMASLNASSAPEDLLAAELNIATYQSVVAQASCAGWNNDVAASVLAAESDLLNAETSNPMALMQVSIDFNYFGSVLLEARVGLANAGSDADAENFYKKNAFLFGDACSDLAIWQQDLLNQAPADQIKADEDKYDQARKKLHHAVSTENRLSLQHAVAAAALTPDEQQLWNQFQSTLAEKCKAACSNYCANPTFANIPGVTDDLNNLDPTNPAAVLEAKLYEKEAVGANIGAFKLLKQGCVYEFLNVLLSKRNDTDSSLNSFHQLQDKLNQFLNNLDVSNPIAVLQAQVDMLSYEKGVVTAPVTLAPTPALK